MAVTNRPRLSALIATIPGWPEAKPAVDSVQAQVAAVSGEIVVVDGSGKPAPAPPEVEAFTRWV